MPRGLPEGGPILRVLSTMWLIVGLTLVLFLAAETTARAVIVVRDSLWPRRPYVDPYWSAEALAASDWIAAYADEFGRSRRFEWHPYLGWWAAPFQGEMINLGPGGIRRTWNSGACGADRQVTRIFMFGGSALWGTGARDDFTIPSLVARELAERGHRDVCAVNWGESGYVSTQELLVLLLQIRKGNVPDVVVFYDGVNDIVAAGQEGVAGNPQNEFNRRAEFNLTKRGGEMIARGLFLGVKASALYRIGAKGARALLGGGAVARTGEGRDGELAEEIGRADDIVRTYAANVAVVRMLGREYGFETLFYWQPVAFVSKRLTADEERFVNAIPGWTFGPGDRYLKRLIHATYARLARHEGLRQAGDFRDLSRVFRDVRESVYFDFVHVSEAGNERVAAEIARDLRTIMVTDQTTVGALSRQRPDR